MVGLKVGIRSLGHSLGKRLAKSSSVGEGQLTISVTSRVLVTTTSFMVERVRTLTHTSALATASRAAPKMELATCMVKSVWKNGKRGKV